MLSGPTLVLFTIVYSCLHVLLVIMRAQAPIVVVASYNAHFCSGSSVHRGIAFCELTSQITHAHVATHTNNARADDVYPANQIKDLKSASTFKKHRDYFWNPCNCAFNYICPRILYMYVSLDSSFYPH